MAMPSSRSPSSSSSQEQIGARPPAIKAASRRLPPPCWSNDETVALIDAYRDKWYSLRRGNLRAPHWQEVADEVAVRCPLSNPPKTSIQCRHKMEKLRKRYRAEIQRIGNTTKGHRHPSSWVHFGLMDSMQLGTSSSDPSVDPGNQDEDDEDVGDDENEDELMLHPNGIKQAIALPINRRYQGSMGNGVDAGNGKGVRIRIPNLAAMQPPPSALSMYHSNRSFDDYPPPVNPRYASGKGSRDGYKKEGFGPNRIHGDASRGMKRKEDIEKNDSTLMDRMVAAIHKLGDDFVKMERMKMDMAREIETSRMEMEMERTKMILESQQKLVDSFSETVMENNKKIKRIPTPES